MKRLVITCVAAAALVCGSFSGSTLLAQGWGNRGGSSIWLLQNEQIRKELEIVDEQVEQLTKLQEEARKAMQETFSGFRDLEPEERQKKFAEAREKMQTMQADLRSKVDKILLPHQVERLEQIGMQMQLRSRGTSGSLTEGKLAETLKITDEQKKKIEEAAKKATKEMNEKIATAREEARRAIIKTLTPKQQEQLEKLIGKQFEWSQQQGTRTIRAGGFGDRFRSNRDQSDE